MLTFNPAVSKGASSEVTLNKTALLNLVPVDDYFADSSNWEKVVVVYKSSTRNQKEILSFDASEESPTASFLISDKSDGDFLLDKVIIRDCDGGNFVIGRSSLEGLSLDVVIASGELSVKLDLQELGSVDFSVSGKQSFFSVTNTNPGEKYVVQTFLAEESFSLSKLDFHAYSNAGIASGNIKVAIWEAGYHTGTSPNHYRPISTVQFPDISDAAISSVETLSVAGITTWSGNNTALANNYVWDEALSPTMKTVEFSTPAELVKGQAYAIMFLEDNLVRPTAGNPDLKIISDGQYDINYGEGLVDGEDRILSNTSLFAGTLFTNSDFSGSYTFTGTSGSEGYDLIIRLSGN